MAQSDHYGSIQSLYIAYYGRWADPRGLEFWVAAADEAGGDYSRVINAFGTSAESEATYSDFLVSDGTIADVEGLIQEIYQNLFGREAEQVGLDFYSRLIGRGELTFPETVLRIFDGARNDDLEVLKRKLEVASYATESVEASGAVYAGQDAIRQATEILRGVSSDAEDVAAHKAEVDRLMTALLKGEEAGGAVGREQEESDSVAPSFLSAAIDSGTRSLELTFDEALDTGSRPDPADFRLGGTDTTVTGVAITGDTATLTLGAAIEDDATGVSVSYTGTALRDAAGNAVANIAGQAVSVADVTPPVATALSLDGAGRLSVTADESATLTLEDVAAGQRFGEALDLVAGQASAIDFQAQDAAVTLRLVLTDAAGNRRTLDERVVLGTDGSDKLQGAIGTDFLFGFAGDDALDGSAGNDWLVGGAGQDNLTGGDGEDRFWLRRGDSTNTEVDSDAIRDLELGDVIDLSGVTDAGYKFHTEGTADDLDPMNFARPLGDGFGSYVASFDRPAPGSYLVYEVTQDGGKPTAPGEIEIIRLSAPKSKEIPGALAQWQVEDSRITIARDDVAPTITVTHAPGTTDFKVQSNEAGRAIVRTDGEESEETALTADGDAFVATVSLAGQPPPQIGGVQQTDQVQTIAAATTVIAAVDEAGNEALSELAIYLGFNAEAGDVVTGSAGEDYLFGFQGDDRLEGHGGADLLDGGGGADTFVLRAAEGQTSDSPGGEAVTIQGFSPFDDGDGDRILIQATGLANFDVDTQIVGDAPLGRDYGVDMNGDGDTDDAVDISVNLPGLTLTNDEARAATRLSLTGTDDADTLKGGPNADRLEGGAGADRLTGSAGSDTFVFSSTIGAGSDSHVEALTHIEDLVAPGGDGDSDRISLEVSGVSRLDLATDVTTTATDTDGIHRFQIDLTGDDAFDSRDDIVFLYNGRDLADGTATLMIDLDFEGSAGDDVVSGSGGDDRFVGKAGADAIDVGGGANQVVFEKASDGAAPGSLGLDEADRILAFDGDDEILFDASLIDTLTEGERYSTFTQNVAAEGAANFDTATGKLYYFSADPVGEGGLDDVSAIAAALNAGGAAFAGVTEGDSALLVLREVDAGVGDMGIYHFVSGSDGEGGDLALLDDSDQLTLMGVVEGVDINDDGIDEGVFGVA